VIEKSVAADKDPDAQYPPGTIFRKVLSLPATHSCWTWTGRFSISRSLPKTCESRPRSVARSRFSSPGLEEAWPSSAGAKLPPWIDSSARLRSSSLGATARKWRPEPGGPVVARAQPLSDDIRRSLLNLAAAEPRIRVEDKRYTIAFHYRHAPDRGAALEERLRQYLAPYSGELRLLRGKSVVEIKPPSFDKGEAIETLMRLPAFAGRRPVFFGDDTTDEDAFAAVRELHGVGISVGRNMPDAELMVPTPKAVRLSLARLVGCDAERIE